MAKQMTVDQEMLAFARRVLVYFGGRKAKIDPKLDCDIEIRDWAARLVDKLEAR